MKNIIFIKQTNYNDTLVGPQLNSILEHCVYINGDWCCYSDPILHNEKTILMTLDNIRYQVNNFIFSKQFDNIIISWDFTNEMLEDLIGFIDSDGYNLTIFNLTNTETEDDIASFELLNKEYQSQYITIQNKLVKNSFVDTTNCSAFKIAKTLQLTMAN